MLTGFTCQKITTIYLAENQLQGLLQYFSHWIPTKWREISKFTNFPEKRNQCPEVSLLLPLRKYFHFKWTYLKVSGISQYHFSLLNKCDWLQFMKKAELLQTTFLKILSDLDYMMPATLFLRSKDCLANIYNFSNALIAYIPSFSSLSTYLW